MRAHDSLYAAGKQALNLNVGEPRTVRMIYFLPNDRPYRAEIVQKMKDEIRNIQTFYRDQMRAHGHGDMTFRFETDAQGDPLVHRLDGQHPDSHYLHSTFGTVIADVRQAFDLLSAHNVYFIVIDNTIDAIGTGGRRVTGVADGNGVLLPGGFHWTTAAHELGHAFDLEHDFRDDVYIMSYGSNPRSLSACHAEFLSVHPYFNPDIPNEDTPSPTIELISSPEYPEGSTSVSIQLRVSDPDGLHQAILSVNTIAPHPATGFLEVKACRGLNGERDAVIQFDYDGVIPSDSSTSLADLTGHQIFVQTVDNRGNVNRWSFKLWKILSQHLATLEGHANAVNSVAFSPDGMTLASGSDDRTIKLWDIATRTNTTTLTNTATGRLWPVRSIAFSPDGTMLATGGRVNLYDMMTRHRIATFVPHTYEAVSVAFSPDGTMLATGSINYGNIEHPIKLWDVATRTNIATFDGHRGWPQSVAFSPDGTILASGATSIKLWDVATRTEIATLEGHTYGVFSVAFSPDGTILVSGAHDNTIKLWDMMAKRNIATFEEDGYVRSVGFSPNGRMLASAGAGDGTVKLWNTSEWMWTRPWTLVKISGDNQQGTPGEALTNPFVVEVRDQYGNLLPDAQVAFTVTTGEGGLSGRFNGETATTDANGRAQSTLTLGPNPGTSIVEASVSGIKTTFNAAGIGIPTPPVTRGNYQTWHLPDRALTRLGKGHISERDRGIAFSPDGQLFAVASAIGIYLYDVATSRERALLTGHDGAVQFVAFSPDGTTLASGAAWDGKIKVWDVATRQNIATLQGDQRGVFSVAFSPDGTRLASGENAGKLKLWDVLTGTNIFNLEGQSALTSVAFSPDGTTLASGAWDGTVKLWNVETGTNTATIEEHTRNVTSVAFSSDGKTLASASLDKTTKLWDVMTQINIATLDHTRQVNSVAFSPLREVKLWDVATRQNIATLGHTYWADSVAFSFDGSKLAVGDRDGTVNLWDVATQNFVTLKHTNSITSVAFSPDGTTLATGSKYNTTNLWNVATGRNITTLKSSGNIVAFSHDGTTLASGAWGKIKLWEVATGHNIAILEGHKGHVTVSFSPDGTTLASGANDGTVRLWDVATRRNIATLKYPNWIRSVSFSPDGTILAAVSDSGPIKLWNVSTWAHIATFEEGSEIISFSPDGTTLASRARDNTVKLWDVATRTEIATLEGHTDRVQSVAFSPDGTTLASGLWNGTIKLWNIATRTEIATLEGHNDIRSVAFSPDGTTLASGSDDGTVLLWAIPKLFPPRPRVLVKISGDEQEGAPGETLTNPYVIEVKDQYGNLLQGAQVRFTVTEGDGTLTVENATTDANGRAQSLLTLGRQPGVNAVEVSVAELEATFNALGGRIWHLPDGALARLGSRYIAGIAFSPDGSTLVAGDRLWDVATGQNIPIIKGVEYAVFSGVFSPDGATLVLV